MYTQEYFLNDIPTSVAVQAHSGTSHVPEKRGEFVRSNYAEYMAYFFDKVFKIAGEEKREEAVTELERYRQGYKDRYQGVLRRRGRVMSTMITGPSNFPTRRNQKASDSYENAERDLVEWSKRVEEKIMRHFTGSDVIRTGSADAVTQLEEKLAKMKEQHEFMRAANKVIKGKGDPDEKLDALLALDDDLTEEAARKILSVPDCYGIVGFAPFKLTNSNARIKAAEEQLTKAKYLATQTTTETMIGKVKMVNNVEDDRLELHFPTRTSKELYADLKGHGFRFTPSKSVAPSGCFQAFRGRNADYYAPIFAAKYNAENQD